MLHNCSFQSPAVNRLGEISVESLRLIELLSCRSIGSKGINRKIRMILPYPFNSLNPVHTRHHMIKEDYVEPRILYLLKTFLAA